MKTRLYRYCSEKRPRLPELNMNSQLGLNWYFLPSLVRPFHFRENPLQLLQRDLQQRGRNWGPRETEPCRAMVWLRSRTHLRPGAVPGPGVRQILRSRSPAVQQTRGTYVNLTLPALILVFVSCYLFVCFTAFLANWWDRAPISLLQPW